MGSLQGASQKPVELTIESRLYQFVESTLPIEGANVKIVQAKTATPEPIVLVINGFEEQKITKNKALKLISAPVVRTLDATKAETSIPLSKWLAEAHAFKMAYVPTFRTDSQIEIDFTVSLFRNDAPAGWGFSTTATLANNKSVAWMFSKDNRNFVHMIKVSRKVASR